MKNTLIQKRSRKQQHSKKEQHPPVNNRAGRLLADWRGGDTTATALPSPPSTDSGIHVDTTISWLLISDLGWSINWILDNIWDMRLLACLDVFSSSNFKNSDNKIIFYGFYYYFKFPFKAFLLMKIKFYRTNGYVKWIRKSILWSGYSKGFSL